MSLKRCFWSSPRDDDAGNIGCAGEAADRERADHAVKVDDECFGALGLLAANFKTYTPVNEDQARCDPPTFLTNHEEAEKLRSCPLRYFVESQKRGNSCNPFDTGWRRRHAGLHCLFSFGQLQKRLYARRMQLMRFAPFEVSRKCPI